MELDYKKLGKRIRKRRRERKMTQSMLAEAVNMSDPHISNIETGKTKVSLPALVAIANALGTTTDDLLCCSIENSRTVFEKEIAAELGKCSAAELRYLYDLIRFGVKFIHAILTRR